VLGAQIQQGDQQRQLVGAVRQPESMTSSSRSANPTLAPRGPGWINVTAES
jgi:hypothetical protein